MRLNISYTPDEEKHVKKITDWIAKLFPAATVKTGWKEKYKHCYIDTARRARERV